MEFPMFRPHTYNGVFYVEAYEILAQVAFPPRAPPSPLPVKAILKNVAKGGPGVEMLVGSKFYILVRQIATLMESSD